MPRFYFDVRQDNQLVTDAEGEEHPNAAAAQREAALAVAHLSKELLRGEPGQLVVEVRDEEGRPVVRAKISLDVQIP